MRIRTLTALALGTLVGSLAAAGALARAPADALWLAAGIAFTAVPWVSVGATFAVYLTRVRFQFQQAPVFVLAVAALSGALGLLAGYFWPAPSADGLIWLGLSGVRAVPYYVVGGAVAAMGFWILRRPDKDARALSPNLEA